MISSPVPVPEREDDEREVLKAEVQRLRDALLRIAVWVALPEAIAAHPGMTRDGIREVLMAEGVIEDEAGVS